MLRGALISELELNQEKEYVGGRKDGCDIRLQAEKGISREHFKLRFADGRWQISAISRFGDVFSLGQKVESIDLQHGQSFQIPPYEFLFSDVPDAGLPEYEQGQAPISIDENERTVIGAVPQVPYIKIVGSKGEVREMLRLEVGEVWVAGRDPSCQIIIPDQRVSRRQFEIYKVNSAYTILDLGSVNGTFVNGTPVSSTDPQTLKSGDAITVLDNTMYFELHDPNFKYKVEKIEVPPLQVEDVVEEFVFDSEIPSLGEGEEVPLVDEYGVPQQLMTTESPFTGMQGEAPIGQMYGQEGMPGYQGQDQAQYYGFEAPPPPEPPLTGIQKLMQNKPMLIGLVLVVLVGAYFLSEMMEPEVPPVQVAVGGDAFSKLTPAQQKEVIEYYKIAEQMLTQRKYDLALEKIRKLKEILPSGYEKSAEMEELALQANEMYLQQKREEELRIAQAEREEKFKKTAQECEKLLSPDITVAQMNQCLVPIISSDPTNSEATRLLSEAEKIEKDRERKELEKKQYESQVKELEKLFADAQEIQEQGYAFKSIKKYNAVIDADLPDPGKLKDKSRERIDFIKEKIKEKSESSIATADSEVKSGNLKEAIKILREAKVYDPLNKSIQNKIDLYAHQLKLQVRGIYQESIIDENFGIIDNTETKEGAKDKWKKITELDIEDGEYYRKAVMKLHRYGEF